MRRLDLTDYTVPVEGKRGMTEIPYSVRDSVVAALFHPELKLNARQALDRSDIARKVRAAGSVVLLEEAEYAQLRASVDRVTGFVEADVPFIRRVLDAPEVDVVEAGCTRPEPEFVEPVDDGR